MCSLQIHWNGFPHCKEVDESRPLRTSTKVLVGASSLACIALGALVITPDNAIPMAVGALVAYAAHSTTPSSSKEAQTERAIRIGEINRIGLAGILMLSSRYSSPRGFLSGVCGAVAAGGFFRSIQWLA